MPIKKSVFIFFVKGLKKKMSRGSLDEKWITKNLSNTLRRRENYDDIKDIFNKEFQKWSTRYSWKINNIKKKIPSSKIEGKNLHINISNEKFLVKEGDAIHKLYLTPNFKHEDKLFYVKKFTLQTEVLLQELCRELYALAIVRKTSLLFKISAELELLFQHADPIVIHYTNPKVKHKILKTVVKVFRKHELPLHKRPLLGYHGFDLFAVDKKKARSYSQLIAGLVAKEILSNEEYFKSEDEDKAAQYLMDLVKKYRAYTFEQVKKALEL